MELEKLLKEHISCVYCFDFPNGKHYVGKCHDLGSRLALYKRTVEGTSEMSKDNKVVCALREYGFDAVGFRVLSSVKCSAKVDAEICLSILEIKYIREIGSIYPNGYNVSLGGEVLGIPIECITTDEATIKSLKGNSKVVLEYDLGGNFIKEYSSISRYAYERGFDEEVVRRHINKRTPIFEKYYLRSKRYDVIPNKIEVVEYKVKERIKYKDIIEERVIIRDRVETREIPAIVYDLNGKFVGEYKSRAEAARHLVTAKGMPWGKYCQGYIAFKKVSDDYPKQIERELEFRDRVVEPEYKPVSELALKIKSNPTTNSRKRYRLANDFPILQLSLDGEIIASHASIRDASYATGIAYCQIYNCVKGQTHTAKGFVWQKAE